MPPRYPVPFAGERAAAETVTAWIRLTAGAAALFGPARSWMLQLTTSAGPRRLHDAERRWARATTAVLGMRPTVVGAERIDPAERYLVAPLHEGFADVLCLLHLPLDLTFAARDELFEWRTIGPYLEASHQAKIPTAGGPGAYRALLEGARTAFDGGESFVVFPQGTILGIEAAFRPGAFRVAQRLGRPVLPVVISGTHRVWEHPYEPTVRLGVPVHVEVLEPVPADRIALEADAVEREMKKAALDSGIAPRRFDPDRDGWWDDYPYEIDPAFPELADRVARHRGNL